MAHLPGNFNLRILTQPNEIAFTHTTHEIPERTAHLVHHAQNSWAYSHNHANHHMYSVLSTRRLPGCGVTFAHVLTIKKIFFFVSLMPCGSQQGAHSPKASYLYDQEYNVVYTQEFQFFFIFKFQCKHSHNYNDVLFHVLLTA